MLKNAFEKIDRFFAFFEDWTLVLSVCTALIVAMANVILRKLTPDINIFWSDEVVRKTIYITTYVGCLVAVRNRSLICIDALPQLLPGLKRPLTMLSHIFILIFAVCMVYLGGKISIMMFHDSLARTSSLRLPEWIFYAVLPIMGLMMFLRTLILIINDWKEGAPK